MADYKENEVRVRWVQTIPFYSLIKLSYDDINNIQIDGLHSVFAENEYYINHKAILRYLRDQKYITVDGDNILINNDLKESIDIITNSDRCMLITHNKDTLLNLKISVYYYNGLYLGLVSTFTDTKIVKCRDAGAILKEFDSVLQNEEGLDKTSYLKDFNSLITEEGKKVNEIKQINEVFESFNKSGTLEDLKLNSIITTDKGVYALREDKIEFIGDDERLHNASILAILDELKPEDEQLKIEEYEKIPGIPSRYRDIPKWYFNSLKDSIKEIVTNKKKLILGIISFIIATCIIITYNIYMSCYINDSFDFGSHINPKVGHIIAYLSVGIVDYFIKGFEYLNHRTSNLPIIIFTIFLFTTIIKNTIRKIQHFNFKPLLKTFITPKYVINDIIEIKSKKALILIITAISIIIDILVQSPVSILLLIILLVLWRAEEDTNVLQELVNLFNAIRYNVSIEKHKNNEKVKVRAFEKNNTVKYSISIAITAMFAYSLFLLVSWFGFHYTFTSRLVLGIACLIEACILLFYKKDKNVNTAVITMLLIFGIFCITGFADDGGWSESGRSIPGLIRNAGFGYIFTSSLLSVAGFVLAALTGIAVPPLIGALIVGAGTVGMTLAGTGLFGKKAAEKVNKSSHQYFYGTKDGDNTTFLCSSTKALNLMSFVFNIGTGVVTNTKFISRISYGKKNILKNMGNLNTASESAKFTYQMSFGKNAIHSVNSFRNMMVTSIDEKATFEDKAEATLSFMADAAFVYLDYKAIQSSGLAIQNTAENLRGIKNNKEVFKTAKSSPKIKTEGIDISHVAEARKAHRIKLGNTLESIRRTYNNKKTLELIGDSGFLKNCYNAYIPISAMQDAFKVTKGVAPFVAKVAKSSVQICRTYGIYSTLVSVVNDTGATDAAMNIAYNIKDSMQEDVERPLVAVAGYEDVHVNERKVFVSTRKIDNSKVEVKKVFLKNEIKEIREVKPDKHSIKINDTNIKNNIPEKSDKELVDIVRPEESVEDTFNKKIIASTRDTEDIRDVESLKDVGSLRDVESIGDIETEHKTNVVDNSKVKWANLNHPDIDEDHLLVKGIVTPELREILEEKARLNSFYKFYHDLDLQVG